MCNINIEVHVLRKNQNEVLNVKTKQKPEIKDAFDGLINRLYIEGENQCTCKNMPIEISKAEMKREASSLISNKCSNFISQLSGN